MQRVAPPDHLADTIDGYTFYDDRSRAPHSRRELPHTGRSDDRQSRPAHPRQRRRWCLDRAGRWHGVHRRCPSPPRHLLRLRLAAGRAHPSLPAEPAASAGRAADRVHRSRGAARRHSAERNTDAGRTHRRRRTGRAARLPGPRPHHASAQSAAHRSSADARLAPADIETSNGYRRDRPRHRLEPQASRRAHARRDRHRAAQLPPPAALSRASREYCRCTPLQTWPIWPTLPAIATSRT